MDTFLFILLDVSTYSLKWESLSILKKIVPLHFMFSSVNELNIGAISYSWSTRLNVILTRTVAVYEYARIWFLRNLITPYY